MRVGGDSKGWETHVTVALWVFVRRTACLVGGHSQLLPPPCKATSTKHPRPHKQEASMDTNQKQDGLALVVLVVL